MFNGWIMMIWEQGGKQLLGSNFVMLYVHWVENNDLKTTAWREQDLNTTDSIQKKIWLGNQMMLILIFLDFFESNDEALRYEFLLRTLKTVNILYRLALWLFVSVLFWYAGQNLGAGGTSFKSPSLLICILMWIYTCCYFT